MFTHVGWTEWGLVLTPLLFNYHNSAMIPPRVTRREAITIVGAVTICGCSGGGSTLVPQTTSNDNADPNSELLMNRIIFPGNPWPNGHAIKEVIWSGRLDPDRGLSFDLHLESQDYSSEDDDSDGDVEDEDAGDWESKVVWNNFHNCILSSTFWGHKRFTAGTRDHKLDFGALSDRTFHIDPLPPPDESLDRAFGIYLLGHDGAADHSIRFTATSRNNEYQLDWSGKIAMEYVGINTFDHTFHARHEHLSFSGVRLPDGVRETDALSLFRQYVVGANDFSLKRKEDSLWLVPT